jgi:hypothetical protein
MADYTITANRTEKLTMALVNSAGAALDCTGGTVRFLAKRSLGDPDSAALVNLSSGTAGAIDWGSQSTGLGTITIAAAQTAGIDQPRVLLYSLQLADATGKIYEADHGTLAVRISANLATAP